MYIVESSDGVTFTSEFEGVALMHFEHKKKKSRVRMWKIEGEKKLIVKSDHSWGEKTETIKEDGTCQEKE